MPNRSTVTNLKPRAYDGEAPFVEEGRFCEAAPEHDDFRACCSVMVHVGGAVNRIAEGLNTTPEFVIAFALRYGLQNLGAALSDFAKSKLALEITASDVRIGKSE